MRLTTYLTLVTALTVQPLRTASEDDTTPLRALESFSGGNFMHKIFLPEFPVSEQRLLSKIAQADFHKPGRILRKRSGGTRSVEVPRVVKRLMGVELPDYLHGRRALQLLRQRLLLAG